MTSLLTSVEKRSNPYVGFACLQELNCEIFGSMTRLCHGRSVALIKSPLHKNTVILTSGCDDPKYALMFTNADRALNCHVAALQTLATTGVSNAM
jgi:hypothetical protein